MGVTLMINKIVKRMIKNEDLQQNKTRERLAKISGIIGIMINSFLFILKGLLGLFTGSISLIADAFNHLGDTASSIITIIRSQYESLLMYQHLYINSTNENHQKLRFESWIMSSMMLRSKIFSEAQQKFPERLLQEQNSIKNLQESIKNNPEYSNLSEKQKKNLIETGSGKLFKSWDTIFDESNFNRQGVFSKIYYITSVYAHSEGTLALQLKESKHLMEDPNMQESNYLMLFYSYLMTNIMIKNVTNKFPLVKERFESLDEKIKYEVDFNYQLSFK